jgi:serine/threonine-protein kinase
MTLNGPLVANDGVVVSPTTERPRSPISAGRAPESVLGSPTGNNATVTASADAEVIDGRYVLEAVIGRGAMADVRSGEDLRLGRSVAVKLLHENLAALAEPRRRFEEEARAAARLTDPNVVAIYDTGEHRGRPFIVMEMLPGRTLRDELAEGPLSEARAREVILHVLRAVRAAHAAGVIHRDIKPANILMTAAGEAKVADFGIAKVAESSDLTATGLLVGTPSYLAPECVTGQAATAASDVYAVGVVLYEALSGSRPFTGATPLAVCHAIASEAPTPLRELCPNMSGDLIAVVDRAMAKEPKARYRSADEMIAALEGSRAPLLASDGEATQPIESEPTLLSPVVPVVPVNAVNPALQTAVLEPVVAPEPTSALQEPGPPGPPFGKRARIAALIAAAAAVLGIAALASGDHGIGTVPTTPVATTSPVTTAPAVTTTAPPPTTPPTKPGKKQGRGHDKSSDQQNEE